MRLEGPGGGEVTLALRTAEVLQAGDVIEVQARVVGHDLLHQETPISRHHPATDLDLYQAIIDMRRVPQLKPNFGLDCGSPEPDGGAGRA